MLGSKPEPLQEQLGAPSVFSVCVVLLFPEGHKVGTIEYVAFQTGFFHLAIRICGSFLVLAACQPVSFSGMVSHHLDNSQLTSRRISWLLPSSQNYE